LPARDAVKVKADGFFLAARGMVSAGGLIRDDAGVWTGEFAYNIGCCSFS